MSTEFVIFLDENRQDNSAKTVEQAIACLFGYMESVINNYMRYERNNTNDAAWIVCDDPSWIGDDDSECEMSRCSREHAKDLLATYGKIAIYAKSYSYGVFMSADAIASEQLPRSMLKREVPHIKAAEKAEETLTRMLSHDDQQNWEPIQANPIKIIHAAESRIFAHNLAKALLGTPLTPEDIDRKCDFATGTISQMMENIDPLRPTRKMVCSVAKSLKVKPEDLWVDILLWYLNRTGELSD
jgi:hypothetical protein